MKVEGQQVERRRCENRGTVGAEDREGGVWGTGLGRRLCPFPRIFLNFLSRYAAFLVQSDAFSDTTRPVPNSLHSQLAENSDIIKPASATLGKGCRGYFKRFFTGGEKRLKAQDVTVTGGIAFGRDSMRPNIKTAGPGIRIGVRSQ